MARRTLSYLVWGVGGHGAVVADIVAAAGGVVVGWIDADPDRLRDRAAGGTLIDEASFLEGIRAGSVLPAAADGVALGVGDNAARLAFLERIGDLIAAPLVHPSAVISPTAVLASGVVVMPNAVVNARASIGRGVIVNSGCIIEHDCVLGDGTHAASGAVLGGGVRLGPRGMIGAGAVVVPLLTLGRDVTVGAGAVVTRDVRDGATVTGVPARAAMGHR